MRRIGTNVTTDPERVSIYIIFTLSLTVLLKQKISNSQSGFKKSTYEEANEDCQAFQSSIQTYHNDADMIDFFQTIARDSINDPFHFEYVWTRISSISRT